MWSQENIKKVKWKLPQWEDLVSPLAPLSQIQLDALDVLSQNVASKKFPQEQNLEAPKSIDTVHEFLSMCNDLEKDTLENTNSSHEVLLTQLEGWKAETDSLLIAVDSATKALNTLKDQHESVSGSTGALHDACRALASHETKLTELSEQISARLLPLTGLEALSQRLSNPALTLAGGSFYLALSRLDQCIQYVEAHPEYKEAALFRAQAHFALSRAVSVLKDSVTQSFTHAVQQVLALPEQTDLSDGAGLALCVGRFQAAAAKARQVLKNIESRQEVAPEYVRLLSDCCEMYISQRRILLADSVSAAIVELTVRHKGDHCTLLRAACAFCLHVCLDEYHLYHQFFATTSQYLTEYLDGLCTSLYDILRPIIIHVNHLETLAELCTILRFELLEEQIPSNPEALESFSRTLLQLLQDVQERLVFRAHVHFQNDILQYNPSPGDLAYPEKLIMMENIAVSVQAGQPSRKTSFTSVSSIEVESEAGGEQPRRLVASPADLHGMWYPPVRRVLATLSRLYRCVDRGIFQGLSQEALASCVRSVAKASSLIANRSSQVDGRLFEMKHLLILREQVSPFHVDFSVQETSLDFTPVKSAVYNLLQKRTQLFSLSNNSLLEFLLEGTPTVKHLTVDSRKEVDKQLKTVCEAFIEHSTLLLMPKMAVLLDQIQSHKPESGKLKDQSWLSPQFVSAAVTDSQRQIKAQLPSLIKSLQLYLACRDTEMLLYRHIKNRVVTGFQTLDESVKNAGFTDEERVVMAIPTVEQVQLILSTACQQPEAPVAQ